MTKQQLAHAQFLHTTAQRANAVGDEIDPKRHRQVDHVHYFDSLARTAEQAFRRLTGRRVDAVQMHELNTESPAEWTKTVVPWTWGQE